MRPVVFFISLIGAIQAGDRPAALATVDPARWTLRDTSLFTDRERGSITLTFRHVRGEPEARLPVAALGWPPDWRAWRALGFEFFATSVEAFSVGFSAARQTKSMIMEPLPGVRILAVIPFDAFFQTRTMVPLLPLGYKAWPQRLFTFERVDEIVFRMKHPSQDSQLTLWNAALADTATADDILDRKPLIDRFGQWIPGNWPGKAHSLEELRALWAQDRLAPARYPFCALGGFSGRSQRGSGFFRTAQVDGRWVFLDPHGHPFFSAGMDLVGYRQGSFATRVTGREYLFEQLPPPGPAWLDPGRDVSFYVANIMERFGPDWRRRWEEHIVSRLRNWGFNTIANWSDRELATAAGMPYVLPLAGWTTRKVFPFPWDFPDVFSEEFQHNVEAAARRQCEPLKNDPNLIGWFIGNEPHWAREFGSLEPWPEMLLKDPEPSATKRELERRLAADPAQAEATRRDFVFACGRKYFETIVAAIRKHDPNHLILGRGVSA